MARIRGRQGLKVFNNLFEFYRSVEWKKFRDVVIGERMRDDGLVYDEVTGKPIVKAYDVILHHKVELTEENVKDYSISLNPENIMIVSHRTHNAIHEKLSYRNREVWLVYGPPLSGKAEWVRENLSDGDLVIDLDSIWECVSGMERYRKPNRLKAVTFRVRDCLIDCVKYRYGKWNNAYVIGGYPLQSERERLCKELGAREIYVEATRSECLERLEERKELDQGEWTGYVDEWFERYMPPLW